MELKESAKSVLQSSMGVAAGETVLVVTDNTRMKIGQALYDAAKELDCEAMLLCMEERQVSGQEPPAAVAEAMKHADVVLCPTAKSLTHTTAKMEAAKCGARVATMPGITEDMFRRGAITADYAEVAKLTAKVNAVLDSASSARIVKDGYTLTMDLTGRRGIDSNGVYKEPGKSGNLPSGEAYIAPLENGSNGETVIDGSMVGIGKLNSPLYVRVENGKLKELKGEGCEKMGVLFENEENATLGELGIGTNPQAILCGVILEDEKVYGTVHIAFGTNASFGGTVKAGCHLDGIILEPDLYLDDRQIISKGKFLL